MRRAHGLRGDVLVRSLSDDPDRFVVGAAFQTDESPPRTLEITAVRPHREGILLGLRQVPDRNSAEALRGVVLTIDPGERRQLDEDEFWPEDLEGLTALRPGGAPLGEVTNVITGAAQDRLAITTPEGRVVEVPFVSAIVTEVDIGGGIVRVDPPPGLFD